MTASDERRVQSEARELLLELWKRRSQIWSKPPRLTDLIPIPVDKIARSILNLTLNEPEEIPSDRPGFQTAGLMDRSSRTIIAAQKYPHEWRRFTIAHEIGHWVLHPNILYHRDRPLNGGEQANESRNPVEREADKFASELLMPRKVLTASFIEMFENPIDMNTAISTLSDSFPSGMKRTIDGADFSGHLRHRSFLIANLPIMKKAKCFSSLAKRFAVSPTAMAIQLETLNLVR